MSYWIYIHTCPNGKKYVGCTVRKPKVRWKDGRGYTYNKHFNSAIEKYGWENITHEVFEVESEEEMYRKEVELISFYKSNDAKYGYNNSSGGEQSNRGCHWTLESREKLSRKMKGLNLGKPKSEIARQRIAEANRRKANDPVIREKISSKLKGRTFSEETRAKIAASLKKTRESQEYKLKRMSYKPNFPKSKYLFPDGSVREMTKASASKYYLNKGIQLSILE